MEEDSLPATFWAVSRKLREHTRIALEPWHISPSQSRAVMMLSKHGAMRLSALAEHLRIAPRSATEVIDDLQERGLAERRPDPSDRRATLVALTDQGAGTVRAIREARATEAERLFAGLDPADRAQLTRILRELRDSEDDRGPDRKDNHGRPANRTATVAENENPERQGSSDGR